MEEIMKRILVALLVSVFGAGITGGIAWGQATAQISGTVKDQSGAVLPGVEVTATQTDTGIMRSAVTNETGSYILANLAIGPYRLEASLPGFRTFVQTGIVLQVNSNPGINPILEVGQVTEQVEVQANAALVETRSTAVGQVIENQRILELPLNGRQVTDLITLSGAAVQTGTSPDTAWQGGVYISIAGGQDFGVAYSLDGAMHTNVYDGSHADAVPRRVAGIQSGSKWNCCEWWDPRIGRPGERRDEIGYQRTARRCVRIRTELFVQRSKLLCAKV